MNVVETNITIDKTNQQQTILGCKQIFKAELKVVDSNILPQAIIFTFSVFITITILVFFDCI
jgi:hypothetical protein